MSILAFDPSISETGYALIDGTLAAPRIEEAGLIRTRPKDSLEDRCLNLYKDARAIVQRTAPERIVIELPQITTRGKMGKRSLATIPNYGMAVAAMLIAAKTAGPSAEVIAVSATEWSRGMPTTNRDTNKVRRVRYAAALFRMDPETFGATTVAGNVADAALLAWWSLGRSPANRASA